MAHDEEPSEADIGSGWVMLPKSLVDMMRDERTELGRDDVRARLRARRPPSPAGELPSDARSEPEPDSAGTT